MVYAGGIVNPSKAPLVGGHAKAGRWILIALLFFAAVLNYVDRGSLSVAAPRLQPELLLSPTKMGFLLSAFFWSYTSFQMVSGWLADRFSVTWVLGAGFLLWSGATLCTGFAGGLVSLALFRFVLGAGESVSFPCFSKVIVAGFPPETRGLPNAVLEAGTKLGPALGTLVGGLIMAHYNWRVMFVVLGLGGMIWLIPWMLWAPRPAATPRSTTDRGPGFRQIAARKAAWGTFLGSFCYTYSYYFLLTWFPSYLVSERHVSLKEMSVLGSLPFWGSAGSAIFCGWLSDRWIRRGGSPTKVRKTFLVMGLLLSISMAPAALVSDLRVAVGLICISYVAFGMFASNQWAVTQALAGPQAVGRWAGLQNAVANLSGIIAPIVTGILVQRTGNYVLAFLSPAVIAVAGVCCYLFLIGEVAPLEWDKQLSSR